MKLKPHCPDAVIYLLFPFPPFEFGNIWTVFSMNNVTVSVPLVSLDIVFLILFFHLTPLEHHYFFFFNKTSESWSSSLFKNPLTLISNSSDHLSLCLSASITRTEGWVTSKYRLHHTRARAGHLILYPVDSWPSFKVKSGVSFNN